MNNSRFVQDLLNYQNQIKDLTIEEVDELNQGWFEYICTLFSEN